MQSRPSFTQSLLPKHTDKVRVRWGRGDVSLNYGAKLLLMTYPILLNLTGASLVTEFRPCFGQVNRVLIISVKANLLLKGYHDNINYSKEKTILDVLALPDPVYFFQFLNIHKQQEVHQHRWGKKYIKTESEIYDQTLLFFFFVLNLQTSLSIQFNYFCFKNEQESRDIRGSV